MRQHDQFHFILIALRNHLIQALFAGGVHKDCFGAVGDQVAVICAAFDPLDCSHRFAPV